jgi:hypothetical protein
MQPTPSSAPGQTARLPPRDAAAGRGRAADAAAVGALWLLTLAFYMEFFRGEVFMWEDLLAQYYPGANHFAVSIASGRFPLWFGGVRNGVPFAADPQMGVFYPLNWLLALFVRDGQLPFVVYQRFVVLHYLLGGWFCYMFLRRHFPSPAACLAGAVVFCFGGFMSLRFVNFLRVQVFVWIPLALWFIDRLAEHRRPRDWLGVVGALWMSLVAGYPQTAMYGWYFAGAYWLFRRARRAGAGHGGGWRHWMREIAAVAGTFLLATLLAAMLIVPALEYWRLTDHSRMRFCDVADESMPPRLLLTALVPNFFGVSNGGMTGQTVRFWGWDPASRTVQSLAERFTEAGSWQYWEFGFYCGQILLFALAGLWWMRRRLADPRLFWFLSGALALGLVWMMGRYGGVFLAAYHLVPGVAMFRGPAKISCVVGLCAGALTAMFVGECLRLRDTRALARAGVCVAAGYAAMLTWLHLWAAGVFPQLDDAARRWFAVRGAWTAATLAAACFGLLWLASVARGRRGPVIAVCGLIGLSFADLGMAYRHFHAGAVPVWSVLRAPPALEQELDALNRSGRRGRFAQVSGDELSEEIVLVRNAAYVLDGLEVVEGYLTFGLRDVAAFQAMTNTAAKLDIQNVRLIARLDPATGVVNLQSNPDALPRARFYNRFRAYDQRGQLWRDIEEGRLDYRTELALERADWQRHPALATASSWPVAIGEEVALIRSSPETYRVEYRADSPGVIFVSETFYPGWIVEEGHEIIPVFGAFKGIVITEPGAGVVTVRFRPRSLTLGLGVSALTALAIVAGVGFGSRRQ